MILASSVTMSLSFVLGAFRTKWGCDSPFNYSQQKVWFGGCFPYWAVAQCQLKEVQFSQLSPSFVQVAFFFGNSHGLQSKPGTCTTCRDMTPYHGTFHCWRRLQLVTGFWTIFSFGSRLRSSDTVATPRGFFLVSVKKRGFWMTYKY